MTKVTTISSAKATSLSEIITAGSVDDGKGVGDDEGVGDGEELARRDSSRSHASGVGGEYERPSAESLSV